MGWERGYYYRKRWVGGRVVSEYVGSGLVAELAAQEDAQTQAARRADAAQRKQERAEAATLDDEYCCLRDLVTAHLLTAGFHEHRRQWRRVRP